VECEGLASLIMHLCIHHQQQQQLRFRVGNGPRGEREGARIHRKDASKFELNDVPSESVMASCLHRRMFDLNLVRKGLRPITTDCMPRSFFHLTLAAPSCHLTMYEYSPPTLITSFLPTPRILSTRLFLGNLLWAIDHGDMILEMIQQDLHQSCTYYTSTFIPVDVDVAAPRFIEAWGGGLFVLRDLAW
jgi:hypothetical protein